MKVYIEKDNKNLDFDIKSAKTKKFTGGQLLKELKINHTSVILVKNDEVVLEDEVLTEKDEIKILSVISGG